jgi:hypothetical protein
MTLGVTALAAVLAPPADAQSAAKTVEECLAALPTEFAVNDSLPQQYDVTTIIYNRNIDGSPKNKIRMTAECTRWIEDDLLHCKWKNVRISGTAETSGPFEDVEPLDYMEDFSYTLSMEVMGEEMYGFISDENIKHLVKMLVWDQLTFEPHFWDHLDKFKLNEQYIVSMFEDFDVQMGDWGTIRMKNLRMAWVGVSEVGGEPCAVLEYESFANPVVSETLVMNINGRSLYWGTIWVSLEDKQVEKATLNEDVMMEMVFPDGNKTLQDMQRDVLFEKVN